MYFKYAMLFMVGWILGEVLRYARTKKKPSIGGIVLVAFAVFGFAFALFLIMEQ